MPSSFTLPAITKRGHYKKLRPAVPTRASPRPGGYKNDKSAYRLRALPLFRFRLYPLPATHIEPWHAFVGENGPPADLSASATILIKSWGYVPWLEGVLQ